MISRKLKEPLGSKEAPSKFFSLDLMIDYSTLSSVLILNADGIPEPSTEIVGQDLYFEILELQPIKLSLSFMRTERVNSEEK